MRRRLLDGFIKGGFLLRLERRDTYKAIYEKIDLTGGHSRHYEVISIIIRKVDPVSFIHQKYRDKGYTSLEVYPQDNRWGELGWTYTELWQAVNKYNSIGKRPREESVSVDIKKLLNSLNS